MSGRISTISLAIMMLLAVGCGDPDPQQAGDTGKTGSPESGSQKLAHDSKPTFTPYRPDSMTGLTSLGVEVARQGEGPVIGQGAILDVYYTGMLMDGTVFEQSDRNKKALTVTLKHPNGVIEGWVQGLVGQREGVRLKLSIPARLAYGQEGRGDRIPPNSDLVFDVEVVKVYP